MNLDNFIVRPKRRLVEKYSDAKAWQTLGVEEIGELSAEIAGLPSEQEDDDQDAKQFDALMLRVQLALLRIDHSFQRLRKDVEKIAGGLIEKDSIPMVRAQMPLIQELLTDEYWQDITVVMLENARKRLRSLVQFVDKAERRLVYTDFEDQMGAEMAVALPGLGMGMDFERFRAKARHFLKQHEDDASIRKLRWNEPLTPADLARLEAMLVEAGGSTDEIAKAKQEERSLGLFLRSLVGLDRAAAKQAFAGFIESTTLTANQLEFINIIIDHLTQRGWMEPSLLYESPFTDFSSRGVEGVFPPTQVSQLIGVLESIHRTAAA
jgi:type I restriction enzyme, R subunit